MRPEASRASGPLMRMPSWPPRPTPTMSAVGVASPRAHGHAMISTDRAAENAGRGPAWATNSQPSRVSSEITSTAGTNTDTTRSTSVCTAALRACACSASAASWASWVWAPILVASTIRAPVVLRVPPRTASPSPTSRGTGSPVIIEVSIADDPITTTPSVATDSPGRTRNRSPLPNSAIGTTDSRPSRITHTDVGARRPRASRTPRADRFERAST